MPPSTLIRTGPFVAVREAPIFASVFKSVLDNQPKLKHGTVLQLLEDVHHLETRIRHRPPVYSPAEYLPGSSRKAENVVRLSFVVLDYDQLYAHLAPVFWSALDDLGFAYAAHTTTRHLKEGAHRYRVIIPLARPASPNEYKQTVRALTDRLPSLVDRNVLDVAHAWAFPFVCSMDDLLHAEFRFRDGKLLDPVAAPALPPPIVTVGRAPTPRSFSVEELAGWLRSHPSSQDDIQRATLALCDGAEWEDDGIGKDSMLWRALASIALRAPGVTEDVLLELIEPSVRAVHAAGSKVNLRIAASKVRAAIKQAERTPRFDATPSKRRRLGPRPRERRAAWFVQHAVVKTERAGVRGSLLLQKYREWADDNGGPTSTKKFYAILARFGIRRRFIHGEAMWPIEFVTPVPVGPGANLSPEFDRSGWGPWFPPGPPSSNT